tara:strand:+ start:107 stop:283 length:177 start_codon:yes stop_codon:yes gene_type:complete
MGLFPLQQLKLGRFWINDLKVIEMKISVELDDEDSLHFVEIIKRLLALLERMEAKNDE